MKSSRLVFALAAGIGLLGSTAAIADPDMMSVVRGARLYDRWYGDDNKPTEVHPLYPADGYYVSNPEKINAAATWRCKECHGYDGLGAAGNDATGNHYTGIIGIDGKSGAPVEDIIAIITSPEHGYSDKFSEEEIADVANFVAYGLIDFSPYVENRDDGSHWSTGDAVLGETLYNTICSGCHDYDGTKPEGLNLSHEQGKAYEMIHRVMNGLHNEPMPALRYFGPEIAADIVAYFETFPQQ